MQITGMNLDVEIGVVVIGRNEGERLINCLASVGSNATKIVYVDSGSTDGSTAAAEGFGATVVALDLTKPFTAARARNEGFAALRTLKPDIRFVQFIDGDCTLVEGWLETAVSFIKDRSDLAIVCGRRRERYPAASVYNQLADIEWDTSIGETSACGGDSLMRAEAFEAAGGFRPGLIAGEEPELCLRLRERGWKIWRLNAEMTLHDLAMTKFAQWWVRAVRAGHAYAEVSQLHRTSPFLIWRRETLRAIFWGGLLPVAICLGTAINLLALVCGLAYVVQICRIATQKGPTYSKSWAYGLFVMLAKFAEFQGIATFYSRRWRRNATLLIEYK